MNKKFKVIPLLLLLLLSLMSTAFAQQNGFDKTVKSNLPISDISQSQIEEGKISSLTNNSFTNPIFDLSNFNNYPKITINGKIPKFYTAENSNIQVSELNVSMIDPDGITVSADPLSLIWTYRGINYKNSTILADETTVWGQTEMVIDSEDFSGYQTPTIEGLFLFAPDNGGSTVYLCYENQDDSLKAGVYDLLASSGNLENNENKSISFIIEEPQVKTVSILSGNAQNPEEPVRVNLNEKHSYQLSYDTKGNADPAKVQYSLVPQTSHSRKTSDYAAVDPKTGLVTFTKPLEEGDSICAELTVDGVQADNPIMIETEGLEGEPDIISIRPIIPTVYVKSSETYKPINNLVTTPFEQPITKNVSFHSSSFDITSSGEGVNFELKAPSTTFTGNTIITATYTLSNGTDVTTAFSVEFLGNKDIAVTGMSVLDRMSFNLLTPLTQNVSPTLLPEDATSYNQTVNYLKLFNFSSNDEKVATVDSYGNVTPVGVGTCTITTEYSQNSTTFKKETAVTVINENLGSITLNPLLLNLNLTNNKTGTITATIFPDDLGLAPTWTNSNELVCEVSSDGLECHVTAKSVGTATITAHCLGQRITATVQVTQDEIFPEGISFYPNAVYLAPQGTNDATVFSVVSATLIPGNATSEITWSSDSDLFDFVPTTDGQTVSIIPKDKIGFGTLTATVKGRDGVEISADLPVTISDKPVVIDAYKTYIENNLFTADSPDYFSVNVYAMANPAMRIYDGNSVKRVTIFAWSNLGQTDINCKVANFNGNGLFSYTFPVNHNEVNNYFDRACNIRVGIYGSFEEENGNLMASWNYNYVNPNDSNSNIEVTPYIQDIGFKTPTVGDGEVAGTEGNNLQLEGFRIATPIDGLDFVYDAHVQDVGWIEQVSSGTYCGTMHLNKQIEGVRIKLTGEQADYYSIRYQAHVQQLGWLDWVSDGELAGTIGENRQLEAIRVTLVPKE